MEEKRIVRIHFEGGEGDEYVTPLGNNLYRMETSPLFFEEDARVGDIIEVETQADGVLRFRRIVERSLWRHWDWVLSKAIIESAPFQAFQQAIEAHNGIWERVLGGVILVHLPPDADFDPEAALDLVFEQWKRESSKADDF